MIEKGLVLAAADLDAISNTLTHLNNSGVEFTGYAVLRDYGFSVNIKTNDGEVATVTGVEKW